MAKPLNPPHLGRVQSSPSFSSSGSAPAANPLPATAPGAPNFDAKFNATFDAPKILKKWFQVANLGLKVSPICSPSIPLELHWGLIPSKNIKNTKEYCYFQDSYKIVLLLLLDSLFTLQGRRNAAKSAQEMH